MAENETEVEAPMTPIWDENNVLVEPEMAQHFVEQSEMVLGTRPVPGVEAVRVTSEASINAPFLSQQLEGQTKDVMTSPEPTSDPNTMPTKFVTMTEEQAERDRAIVEGAQRITEAQVQMTIEETPPAPKSTSPDRKASDKVTKPVTVLTGEQPDPTGELTKEPPPDNV